MSTLSLVKKETCRWGCFGEWFECGLPNDLFVKCCFWSLAGMSEQRLGLAARSFVLRLFNKLEGEMGFTFREASDVREGSGKWVTFFEEDLLYWPGNLAEALDSLRLYCERLERTIGTNTDTGPEVMEWELRWNWVVLASETLFAVSRIKACYGTAARSLEFRWVVFCYFQQ